MRLYTAGYEGTTIDAFVGRLKQHGVGVLIDVRLTPISRKKGFSKTALRERLESAGVRYVHLPQLGNPKRFRVAAASSDECIEMYREHMDDRWDDALAPLIDELAAEDVCIMCMERDCTKCHRHVVAHEVVRRRRGVAVQHI